MTDETIVAVYDTSNHADAVLRDLEAAGIPTSAISRHAATTGTATGMGTAAPRETGFWASLFGGEPDHDTGVYDRSLESGSEVLTVKVPETQVATVSSILERHNPIDIDERATSYGLSAPSTMTTTTRETLSPPTTAAVGTATVPQGGILQGSDGAGLRGTDETLQLSEEQIQVGKRLVNRGTTRIRRFVVETPVEESVTLHSEQVSIERRPVTGDVPATIDPTDKVIEVTETEEQAVVGKSAHVREEVVVHKEATDRVETVHDTVRREDVEITKDGTAETSADKTMSGTVPPVRR